MAAKFKGRAKKKEERQMKKNTNNLGWLPCFRVKTVVPAKEGTAVGKRILDLEKGITNDCNWYGLYILAAFFIGYNSASIGPSSY